MMPGSKVITPLSVAHWLRGRSSTIGSAAMGQGAVQITLQPCRSRDFLMPGTQWTVPERSSLR